MSNRLTVTALIFSFIALPAHLLAEQVAFLPTLQCKVRHSYGSLGGYSTGPNDGDTVTLNLNSLTKKNAKKSIHFTSSAAYIPFQSIFQLTNEQHYTSGDISSQLLSAKSSSSSIVELGVSYGVAGPYEARATISYKDNEIMGIVFLDCNLSKSPNSDTLLK